MTVLAILAVFVLVLAISAVLVMAFIDDSELLLWTLGISAVAFAIAFAGAWGITYLVKS